jgi:hypothetical protein
MIAYKYIVKKRHLCDAAKSCLMGGCEVLSSLPPRRLRELNCADFQFPNGDTYALQPKAVDLTSAEAIE